MDFDTSVKLKIYEIVADTGIIPTAVEIATALEVTDDQVVAAFQRLHQKRLLVPEPGDPTRIRMAPPFSGIETQFLVRSGGEAYYANCVWDALGIPTALHQDARIEASDGFTGEPMVLEVRDGKPLHQDCSIHFAVPAARWWQDIIYT